MTIVNGVVKTLEEKCKKPKKEKLYHNAFTTYRIRQRIKLIYLI